jgi:hypothetical protein
MTVYDFDAARIPDNFFWFNEPQKYFFDQGLNMVTKPKTDFWQNTHYGFRRDDGHCLLTNMRGDFSIKTQTVFNPISKYDQCGLMARIDKKNWIKCSVEYESSQISRLGSVVTSMGFSDWATQDISSDLNVMFYRINKRGKDFLIEHSRDGNQWHQMRITHLHEVKDSIDIGVYTCSPIGNEFQCTFRFIELGENIWQAE